MEEIEQLNISEEHKKVLREVFLKEQEAHGDPTKWMLVQWRKSMQDYKEASEAARLSKQEQ